MKTSLFLAMLLVFQIGAHSESLWASGGGSFRFQQPSSGNEEQEVERIQAELPQLFSQTRYNEALLRLNRLVEIRERTVGREHPLFLAAVFSRGLVQRELEDFRKSLVDFNLVLNTLEKQNGADAEQLVLPLIEIGFTGYGAGEKSDAHKALLRAVEICDRKSKRDAEFLRAARLLASSYRERNEFRQSAELLERLTGLAKSVPGMNDTELAEMWDACVCAWAQAGNTEKEAAAQKHFAELAYKKGSGEVEAVEKTIRGRALKRSVPNYPVLARRARIQGDVTVRIRIDEEGKVISACAVSGPLELRKTCEYAARQWLFKPTVVDNVPVRVKGAITFRFEVS